MGLLPFIGLIGTCRIGGLGDDGNAFMLFKKPAVSLTHDRVVIDKHDADISRPHDAGPAVFAIGIVTLRMRPFSGLDTTLISPPSASVLSRIPISPRPKPASPLILCANPAPSSSTVASTRPAPDRGAPP